MADRDGAQREDRYRSLFKHHPHAVFLLDLEGRFTEVNPACARISGRTVDDLLDTPFADLLAPDDVSRGLEAFQQAVLDGLPKVELAVQHVDGRLVDIDVTGIPWVADGEVQGVYGVAEDITERNRVTRDLAATQQVAAAANQAKTDFATRMSHELRTPLTSILATVELLASTEDRAERDQLVAVLQRAGTRLHTLVDDVLDFAAAGTAQPHTEVFDLHAAVRSVVARVAAAADAKGLPIVLDIGAEVPQRVRDHPTWTTQVLSRLLADAVEHTEAGQVGLTVTLAPPNGAGTGAVVLYRVSDTGTGAAPRPQEPDESSRPDPGPTADAGPPSPVLSTVEELVSLCGGTIAVDHAPGRGSTVHVAMPFVPVGPVGPTGAGEVHRPVEALS